jgi:5-formyltetrahydrofolate cyclo-ligase
MQKKEARRIFREKRNALTAVERSKMDDLLLIQFQTVDLPFISNVFSYWPIEENKEPNTHLFTDYLEFKFPDLKLLYPKSDFANNQMQAVWVNEETLFTKNPFNIYEPEAGEIVAAEKIDMIIVPLLVADRNGYRVGYGKGFYDKFLASCREDCIKVGFSYFEPLEAIDDCNEFDVPLDLCITPQNVYVF